MREELPQKTPTTFVLGVGKDEMNLVELPFTSLTEQSWSNDLVLERRWNSTGNDGKVRNFYKRVTGHPVYGLPAFQAEEVYVAMMEVSHRQGFENRKVHTTKYELLKIMKWGDTGQYYRRLREILEQLLAVTITTNAFWDNMLKGYREIGFHIIDEYNFFEAEKRGRKSKSRSLSLPLGYFSWGEILFESFRSGYIKTLNTDVYFSLGSYISKRLYRYEDKQLYLGEPFEIDLFRLALEKLEMSSNYRYPSEIVRKFKPAIQEHKEKGLAKISIRKSKTPSGYKVVFAPITRPHVAVGALTDSTSVPSENGKATSLISQLTLRGITERSAETLVKEYKERIEPKIEVFDWLVQSNNPLIKSNPAGFLRKSIEENWQPPSGFVSKAEREKRARQAQEQKQQREAREREAFQQEHRKYIQRRAESPWKDLWEQMASELRGMLSQEIFSSWIEPTLIADVKEDVVVLSVPNSFFARWIEEHYAECIEGVLSAIRGQPTKIQFICDDAGVLP